MNPKIILAGITVLFLASCQEILFTEEKSSREIKLNPFGAVIFKGIYDIVFIQDGSDRLVITGSNCVGAVDVTIINDTLTIFNHKYKPLNAEINRIELHFTDLYYITNYYPANISNRGIIKGQQILFDATGEITDGQLTVECNHFGFFNSGNTLGHMRFYGKSESVSFFNQYGSVIFADSLTCRNAEITNNSAGAVYVNASESINAAILGPGNIYFYGNPVITISEKRGDGKMIRK